MATASIDTPTSNDTYIRTDIYIEREIQIYNEQESTTTATTATATATTTTTATTATAAVAAAAAAAAAATSSRTTTRRCRIVRATRQSLKSSNVLRMLKAASSRHAKLQDTLKSHELVEHRQNSREAQTNLINTWKSNA